MDNMSFTTDLVPEFAHGLKILLIDNDTYSLKYTASVLEQYSFNVAAVQQASEALSLISEQNHCYELVMANINMSDSDSVPFLHTLLEKDIPVILMSSEMNDDLMRKALDKGASFFLQKPIPLEDLKNVWQYVYWKTNPMKATGKENCEEWMDWLDNGVEMNEDSEEFGHSFGGGSDKRQKPYESDVEDLQSYSTEDFFSTESEEQKASGKKHSADNTVEQGRMKRSKPTIQQTDSNSIARYQDGIVEKHSNDKTKKKRIVWTPDLHYTFTAAISALGDEKARPKAILNMMGVKGVTMRQVASHLQKYKNQVRRIYQTGIFTGGTSLSNSSNWNQGTSRFGGGGIKPIESATPSSSTRSSISAASFNNHDYRMQNRNSSHEGLSRYGNHDTNCPNDSLRTDGWFQHMNQIPETSALAYRNELIEYLKRRQRLGLEESNGKVTENLPSMTYMTSEVDSPNMSTNTFQLPNQPPVVHQEQNCSPALTEPFDSRKQKQVSTEVLEQQNMNLPSTNDSTPEAHSPYILANAYQFSNELSAVTRQKKCTPVVSGPIYFEIEDKFSIEDERSELLELMPMNLPSTNYMTPEDISVNQEKYHASANSTSSGTHNSFSTEVAGTNELLDFLLDSSGKEYMTDGDTSTQKSENAVQLPKEPLLREQFCTPGLNGHFGTQYENKFSERTTELGFLEKETPSFIANNLGNLPGDFNDGSEKLDSLAGEEPPAISSNEHQPLSEYANLLTMLEDEPEEYSSFAPYAGNVDDYFQWLEETLFADSTEEQ
ncbi:hypothetical protein ACLB2K_042656 [Fragaria x ananassa]